MIVELGGYREFRAPSDLRDVIDVLWFYSRPEGAPPIPGAGHRVLPETGVSLCFWSRRDVRGLVADPQLTIIGPCSSVHFFSPGTGLHLEAVRLKPEWSRDLLRLDPADHLNTDDARVNAPRLLERLSRTRTSVEALAVLADHIRERRDAAHVERAAVVAHEALQRIRVQRNTIIAVNALARQLRVSERQLRRDVIANTGLTVKQAQRIMRLNRAIAIADRDRAPDWASLAAGCGFYDQSHLINEVRTFTGLTPSALHAERSVQQS